MNRAVARIFVVAAVLFVALIVNLTYWMIVRAEDLRTAFAARYAEEPFVHLLPEGVAPATRMVRGSSHVVLNAFPDRIAGRAIVIVAIDNLVKGSSGQAIQNMNLMFGLPETMGLEAAPLFP